MLKWFISPTGEKLLVKDCLEKGLLSNYFTLAYLNACASIREWTGKASTTQLIDGTRLSYLKLLVPYAEDPDESAFKILGTRTHASLEIVKSQKDNIGLSVCDSL